MSSKRHKHEFTGLWWHFGPYGPQDVHVHTCVKDEPGYGTSEPWRGDCDRVLIGQGRDCDGKPETHHRETLGEKP